MHPFETVIVNKSALLHKHIKYTHTHTHHTTEHTSNSVLINIRVVKFFHRNNRLKCRKKSEKIHFSLTTIFHRFEHNKLTEERKIIGFGADTDSHTHTHTSKGKQFSRKTENQFNLSSSAGNSIKNISILKSYLQNLSIREENKKIK